MYIKKILTILSVLFSLLTPVFSIAAPLFTPGQTLYPTCFPADIDCAVAPAALSGANSDITSLSALTDATTTNLFTTNFTLSNLNGLLFGVDGIVSAVSTTSLFSNYLTVSIASTTFMTFEYASSTFASTTYVNNNFPTFTYASSTFPSFEYASSTFATLADTNANFVPYTGATADVNLNTKNFITDGLIENSAVLNNINLNTTASNLSVYPPAYTATYVVATDAASTPYRSTNPAYSLTGSWASIIWLATATTNQRFHIDLGSAKTITRIYYENLHHFGALTDRGVKNFTFWGSNTAGDFADTVYVDDGTWVQLTTATSSFDKHVSADTVDPKYINVSNATPYRYYAFKFADNWGHTVNMGVRRIELQDSSFDTTFATRGLERMRIDNNGNVGIGTTTSNATLTIGGSGSSIVINHNTGNYLYASPYQKYVYNTQEFMRTYMTGMYGVVFDTTMGPSTGDIAFLPKHSVGIGTTTPAAKLDIYGTAGSGDIFGVSSSSNARLFTITSAGNVGIGTSTPNAKLQITNSGTGNAFIVSSSSNIELFTIASNGSTTIASLTAGVVRSTASGALYTDNSNYLTSESASTSFVTYDYASSTFLTINTAVADYVSTSSLTSTLSAYLSTTSAAANYVSTTTLTSNYPTFTYASSTFFPIASSTEVLNAANFVPVLVPGTITYDANTLAAYHLEQNLNDSTGNGYTGVQTGTPTYGNTSPTPYQGSYWMRGTNANRMNLPASLATTLSTSPAWTTSFYWYRDSNNMSGQDDLFGGNSNTPFLLTYYPGASGCGTNNLDFWIGGAQHCFSYSGYNDKWTRINIEWTGTRLKIYLDGGTAKADFAQATNLIASTSVLYQPLTNSTGGNSTFDKLVVSNVARGGAEVTATDQSAYVTPKIGADSAGNLYIQSVNGNSVIGSSQSGVSGFFGIGTSTPKATLDVYATNPSSSDIFGVSSSSNARLFTITSAGNVGIGTSTPLQTLSIIGSMGLSGALYDSVNATGTSGMILTSTGTSTTWISSPYAKLDGTNQPFTGNINIATTSAELRLTDGNYARLTRTSTNNQANLYNQTGVPIGGSVALGGTITYTDSNGLNPRSSPSYVGGYTVHTFTTTGQTFTPGSPMVFEYLIVAGGGGGGSGTAGGNTYGGGGGAGGMRIGTTTISTNQTIIIGAGGSSTSYTNGATSSIGSIIESTGGGSGGAWGQGGKSGGSGGAAGYNVCGAGTGIAGQGNNAGGACSVPSGGGGSGAVGGTGGANGGNGGAGLASVISGVSTYYAGGGGGGFTNKGTGGNGGGGNGADGTLITLAVSGTSNTGGGGGGGKAGSVGGDGGSGIVIIRYPTPGSIIHEISLIDSQDSLIVGEYGVNTFGDGLGATHLNGDALYFDINGTNKLIVDANGNLGIGTSTPSQALSVVGNILTTGTITASNFSGTSTGINTGDESSSSIRTKLGSASSTNDGYLSASDWTLFNGKLSTSTASSTYLTIANATSTYLTYSYASSSFLTMASASSSFPTFSYASSTYLTQASSSSLHPTFAYASTSYFLYSSSTEKLNAANFVPVLVSGAVTYDVNTLAAYNFENNGNDSLNSYNLSTIGTGPVYQTDLVKQGTYSYSVPAAANYSTIPTALTTALGATSQWTIEGWEYLTSAGSSIYNMFVSINWGSVGDLTVFSRRDNGTLNLMYNGASAGTTANLTLNTYHFFSVQWNGSQVKVYVDGTLVSALTITSSVNVFASTTNLFIGKGGLYGDTWNASTRIDKMVVSNIARNGVETIPADTSAYIVPKIGADSHGNLYIKSVNGTTVAGSSQAGVSGFFGIGTSTPSAVLDVYATNPSASDIFGVSSSSNARLFTITSAGNVGIGTSTPSTALVVIGTSTLQDIIPAGPYTGNMSPYSIGASTTRWNSIWSQYINIGTSTWSLAQTGDRFGIFNQANGAGTEAFTILSNGNVGIGTTTPESALTIVGNISATGTITGSNISGINTGDESSTTIRTKIGVASSTNDGYLTISDWSTFNNKLSTTTAASTYLFNSSSTEVLNKAYFAPVTVSGTVTYDANTVCVYEFEGNKNETINGGTGYNLVPNGTGGTTNASLTSYFPTPKYGTQSYYTLVGQKWDTVGQNCESQISGATQPWSVQWWEWLPTKKTESAGYSDAQPFTRGANSGTSQFRITTLTNNGAWNPSWGNELWMIGNLSFNLGAYSTSSYSATLVGNSWNHYSVEFDGDKVRVYTNGTIAYTSGSGAVNPFATVSASTTWYLGAQYGNDYNTYFVKGMDRLTISKVVRGGTELVPADTSLNIRPYMGVDTNGNPYILPVNGTTVAGSSQAGVSGFFGIGTSTPKATLDVYATQPSTSDIFGVSSSSLERLFTITSSGNVGIGTSTPTSKLDIYGTAGSADIFGISSSSNARLFTITSAGNVGIGTTTPTSLLTIYGSSPALTISDSRNASWTIGDELSKIAFTSQDNSSSIAGTERAKISVVQENIAGSIHGLSFSTLYIGRGETEKMRIAGNGLVGIGTSTPSANLDIYGLSAQATSDLFAVSSSSNARLFTITSAGNVGIGTTVPIKRVESWAVTDKDFGFVSSPGTSADVGDWSGYGIRLYTSGSGAIKSGLVQERVGTYGIGKIHILNNGVLNDTNATLADARLTIDSTGNVGIGTTSPASKLDVYGTAGTADIFGVSSSSNARLFTITSAGNVITDGLIENSVLTNSIQLAGTPTSQYVSTYPPAQSTTYVKATSQATNYFSYIATDPTKSLTGNWTGFSWITPTNNNTNQRFHIDLGSAKKIEKIYYENLHSSGVNSGLGVKNFTFWGSNTAGDFADTVYANDGTWVQLTTSQSTFDEHVASNVADPKYITVTNTTSYRYYAFKFADNWSGATQMGVRRIELQERSDDTIFTTRSTERMRILGNGTIEMSNDNYGTSGGLQNNLLLKYNGAVGAYKGASLGFQFPYSSADPTLISTANITWAKENGTDPNSRGFMAFNQFGIEAMRIGSDRQVIIGNGITAGLTTDLTTIGVEAGNYAVSTTGGALKVVGGKWASGDIMKVQGFTGSTGSLLSAEGNVLHLTSGGGISSAANSYSVNSNILNVERDYKIGSASIVTATITGAVVKITDTSSTTTASSSIVHTANVLEITQNNITSTGALIKATGLSNFVVMNSGNVGIGTSTPSTNLDIYGTSTQPTQDLFGVSSSSNARLFTITSAGKVGIGTSTPSATLAISGTPTTTLLQLVGFGAGSLTTDANGNVLSGSDERLKDIQGDYSRGLEDIKKINPIQYKWKTETGYDTMNVYTGFSAQNMQIAIPEAVGSSSAGYLTLSDRPILAAIVNAVKEIGSFITKIENGIAYLTNIVVEKFTLGSDTSPSGITMYDRVTKEPYCVSMIGGVLTNENGICSSDAPAVTTPAETPVEVAPLAITINGETPITVYASSTYTDLGATAFDSVDGDITANIIATGTVDTNILGTYNIVYTVMNSASSTVTATRVVNVVEEASTTPDIIAPVVTINGLTPIDIIVDDTYEDAGATATDNIDTSVMVTTDGTVDTTTAGIYTITYTATDIAGNIGTTTRTVNVN